MRKPEVRIYRDQRSQRAYRFVIVAGETQDLAFHSVDEQVQWVDLTSSLRFIYRLWVPSEIRQEMRVERVCPGVGRVQLEGLFEVLFGRRPLPVVPEVAKCKHCPRSGQVRIEFDSFLSGCTGP